MNVKRFQLPNGAYLSYAEYGAPDGQPLLLLHGLVGSVCSDGLEEQLRAFPLRVIALARPGYGASDYFDMDCAADWGRHLAGFFEYLGIQRFDVLGILPVPPMRTAWRRSIRIRLGRSISTVVCPKSVSRRFWPSTHPKTRLSMIGSDPCPARKSGNSCTKATCPRCQRRFCRASEYWSGGQAPRSPLGI